MNDSAKDMRKLMEMSTDIDDLTPTDENSQYIHVICYGGAPVMAAVDQKFALAYVKAYQNVAKTDPAGPKDVITYRVKLRK